MLACLQPRIAAADTIAGFHEEGKSPFVKAPIKTILHQGEVKPKVPKGNNESTPLINPSLFFINYITISQ